jgi:hypothetical protein
MDGLYLAKGLRRVKTTRNEQLKMRSVKIRIRAGIHLGIKCMIFKEKLGIKYDTIWYQI